MPNTTNSLLEVKQFIETLFSRYFKGHDGHIELRLIGEDAVSKFYRRGESALAQFALESPTAALYRDRFIIRTFSPLFTIGGGEVLDTAPARHKRLDPAALEAVRKLDVAHGGGRRADGPQLRSQVADGGRNCARPGTRRPSGGRRRFGARRVREADRRSGR